MCEIVDAVCHKVQIACDMNCFGAGCLHSSQRDAVLVDVCTAHAFVTIHCCGWEHKLQDYECEHTQQHPEAQCQVCPCRILGPCSKDLKIANISGIYRRNRRGQHLWKCLKDAEQVLRGCKKLFERGVYLRIKHVHMACMYMAGNKETLYLGSIIEDTLVVIVVAIQL